MACVGRDPKDLLVPIYKGTYTQEAVVYMLLGTFHSLSFNSTKMLLEAYKRCLKTQLLEKLCWGEQGVDDKRDMTTLDCVVQLDSFFHRLFICPCSLLS